MSNRESSEEMAKLAAYVLSMDQNDVETEDSLILLKWLKQLAGSVLSQYEENE